MCELSSSSFSFSTSSFLKSLVACHFTAVLLRHLLGKVWAGICVGGPDHPSRLALYVHIFWLSGNSLNNQSHLTDKIAEARDNRQSCH